MNVLEARRRLLGAGVYKKTVEGNPAIAQGSLSRRNPGITMQGWTEQARYEGKNLFDIASSGFLQKDKERVVFDNSDKKSANFFWTKNVTAFGLQGGKTYTSRAVISTEEVRDGGDSAGSMWKILYLQDNASFSMNEKYAIVGSLNANGICYTTFTLPEDISALQYVVTRVKGYSRTIFSEIMIVEGDYNESNFPEYEPYTGGAPSPNPDYPQEIVSAGKYDEGTGKYQYTIKISDSEESPTKSQTVTLASDRPLTKWDRLEKRNGVWGWVYKSEEIESYTDGGVPGEYFSTTGQLSTGAQVWYETTTETFVPLSESEQEQMNELYTFRPTTVLSNDCNCDMSLTYKTKKSMQSAPGGYPES